MGKRLWAKAPAIASGADRRPPAEAPGSCTAWANLPSITVII
jgi:hypothetical protein